MTNENKQSITTVMNNQANIAILGAGGYTGAELLRLLLAHPHVEIAALTADTQAGKDIADVYPHLHGHGLPKLARHEEVDFSGIEMVFCCLPHGTTQQVAATLPEHLRIVDLSADFRLRDPALYAEWYGHAHQAKDLQKEAVYGLTEHYRERIRHARLIANPGCYPTSILLPLLPLLEAGDIAPGRIIADSKSGITGAGRGAKQELLYAEMQENFKAYGIGRHRHWPEMMQEMADVTAIGNFTFTPHLLPINRGILSTIYVTLSKGRKAENLRSTLQARYAKEPFVQVMKEGHAPATAEVRGTNLCRIGVFDDGPHDGAVIISVIDNLGKGAAGQAVQNMNLMMGWPETTALPVISLVP